LEKRVSPEKMKGLMEVAIAISRLSKDPKRKVGTLIVDQDLFPISWGFNGTFSGSSNEPNTLTQEEKLIQIIHSELNAIFNAARRGISVKDCILFCTLFPCPSCANAIIQSKIATVVAPDTELLEPDSKWSASAKISKELFKDAGTELFLFPHINRPYNEYRSEDTRKIKFLGWLSPAQEAVLISSNRPDKGTGWSRIPFLDRTINVEGERK
jgi:dCMP deaminase